MGMPNDEFDRIPFFVKTVMMILKSRLDKREKREIDSRDDDEDEGGVD